jgi:hypothetical protein
MDTKSGESLPQALARLIGAQSGKPLELDW